MITTEVLLKSGYQTFINQFKSNKDHYVISYQKCIRDEKGKKMSINFDEWKPFPEMPESAILNYKFSSYVQLNALGETFNVDFFVRSGSHTIEDVEKFYFKMFDAMECDYYEEYN